MNTAMLMTPKAAVTYLYGDISLEEGIEEFRRHGFTAVPVIDRDGIYIGVVRKGAFLDYILETGSVDAIKNTDVTLADISTDFRFEAVTIDADVDTLFNRIVEQNFVPVVDSRGMFSGIVTRKSVLMRLDNKLKAAEGNT